ncbi:MAG: ferrous iron transport protein A [Promethearchaeota archaeon]
MPKKFHRHRCRSKRRISLLKCLTECNKGEETRIISVNAGLKSKKRLANLGIIPGTIIKKKREAPFHGPLEILVKGSTLALGRGLASKIFVEFDKTCSR